MEGDRSLAVISHPDQWARCSHRATGLVGAGVELAWEPVPHAHAGPTQASLSGLAFDRSCHAYVSRTALGRVDVVATSRAGAHGICDMTPGRFSGPTALAVDDAQRLYVLEPARSDVLVFDLWARRQLSRTSIGGTRGRRARAADLERRPCGALVLTADPPGLVELAGRRRQRGPLLRKPRSTERLQPMRVAAYGDTIAVLWTSATGAAPVVATPDGTIICRVAGALDVAFDGDGRLLVGRGAGEALSRWRRQGETWVAEPPAAAPGYDGGAVSRAPDGRIGYTTEAGVSFVGGDDVKYARSGRVVTYRLDAGSYRARWGRLFLEGCMPRGTAVTIRCLTSDEEEVPDPLPVAPPARGPQTLRSPDATPPLPSVAALADPSIPSQALYRTEERMGEAAGVSGLARYEAPVIAPPGRYLWVELVLSGSGKTTPRVEALRVERPGHRLLDALPGSWSRNPSEADFLQRFLAPAEGLLHGLDEVASQRDSFVDPNAVPERALDWLAALVGFTLDRRWPVSVRRAFIASAYELYRMRGTAVSLERALYLYLLRPVHVVERWRLAGLGGIVLAGDAGGQTSELPPRIASPQSGSTALDGFTIDAEFGGAGAAHRFTVIVPMALDEEQRSAVLEIVERFKPAHTAFDVCEVGDGMRMGAGLLLELTSVVGPGTDWTPLVVGDTPVGVDALLDMPRIGARVGETVLSSGVRGDGVRVG